MNNNNYDFFFWLGVFANLVQLESYELLLKDANNNDIMRHLEKQDRVLDDQTHTYLEKIIKQNEEIKEMLERRL